MATTACPNCGKPLRPGAKFCGSCGHVISAAPQPGQQPAAGRSAAAAPPASPAQPEAQPGGQPCPHCGKLLRGGAKFCNNCGKSIAPSGPVPAASPPPPAAPQAAHAPQPSLSRTPAVKSPAAVREQPGQLQSDRRAPSGPVAGAPPRTPPPAARPAPRKGLRLGIIAAALLLCLAVVVAGYFAFSQFGPMIFGTPTEVAQATTEEFVDKPTQTALPPLPTTQEGIIHTPTLTITLKTQAATLEPTQSVETPAPSESPPAASPDPSPQVSYRPLIEEDFANDDWRINWLVWGTRKPRLTRDSQPPFLELLADSNETGGMTSNNSVPYQPGVRIEFEHSLHSLGLPTRFYWDPSGVDREQLNNTPSTPPGIQLTIRKENLLFLVAGTQVCDTVVAGKAKHIYQIRISPGASSYDPYTLELVLDEFTLTECSASFDLANLEGGKISFTGHGQLYSIKVLIPVGNSQ